MRKPLAIALATGAILLLVLVSVGVFISRQRVRRHRLFRPAPASQRVETPAGIPPVEQWSDAFLRLDAPNLSRLLDRIEKERPDLYARWSLGYLHARSLIDQDDLSRAANKLAPYVDAKNPLYDLALYHQAEIDDARDDDAAASRNRQALIFNYRSSNWAGQAIEDEADYLASLKDPARLGAFVQRINPVLDTAHRRELSARVIEATIRSGNLAAGSAAGFALLAGGTTDDAADRVSRALDRPDVVRTMTPQQMATMGEAMQDHRHFDRAVAFLSAAAAALPAKRDDLQFAVGRSFFGNEKYAEAQQAYLGGAAATGDPEAKSTFLFHASRAAQLLGDDAGAERLMTAAIAVPGKFPSTAAAITQRLRTRAKQRRFAEAAADLQLLRKMAPGDRAVVEAALPYALALLAGGKGRSAISILNSVPPKLLDKFDAAEFAYWRARALETTDPHAALAEYLAVLRAPVPTHFAYFARQRLDSPAMAPRLNQELAVRDAQIQALIATKQFAMARQIATDRILISSRARQSELKRLAQIYDEIPRYGNVLRLQPFAPPRFPLDDTTDRGKLLMALGLYDEAADAIHAEYPLRPPQSALTQALALNRGGASRDSIFAVEVMMKSIPADYYPDLLPLLLRQLLYPRYFYGYIVDDAKRYGADPKLVLAIMREESRFDPRAKSQAAARGLLQFIITTARDIGRDVGLVDVSPDDLYDPRIIIRLGAKYVSELSKQFASDRYMTAAAYNAGPKQVGLWARLAPAAGDDYFLSTINFDETKNYVRKVMNSYHRYGEIYDSAGPQGGMRIEP